MTGIRRCLTVVVTVMIVLTALGGPVLAHPLGNFTTNTFARLRIQPERVAVDYVVDLAEIPALQAIQGVAGADDELSAQEAQRYGTRRCGELLTGLRLRVDGQDVALEVAQAQVSQLAGQAGLTTLRLECALRGPALSAPAGAVLTYTDTNLAERIGWREVIAVEEGRSISSSDVPSSSVSDALRAYPKAQISSPLDVTSAQVVLGDGPGGVSAAVPPPAQDRAGLVERITTAFTQLVASRRLTVGFGLFAFLVALVLGALHALAPGHGKTVMAAYLVGRQGTGHEALLLGVTVAVTHTTGVLLLGLVVSASQSLAPERLYPILGAASGVLFAIVGATMLRQALAARRSGGHGHGHGHGHDHDHDSGGHGHTHPDAAAQRGVGWRGVVVPGLAGGLVPTPSALVVLLGGVAIGRAWFGVLLVVLYGLGMAATLVGAGYLLLRARTRFQRQRQGRRPRLAVLGAALPVVSAVLITVGGVIIAARSLVTA